MSFFQHAVRRFPDSYTAQIVALDAYSSNLRARLVSTLDAIDALQLSHKQELEDLQRRMHTLHSKYRMLKERVKSAETERDELREGVELLIQKVEIAHDYRDLPHATIHMTAPLDPIQSDLCQGLSHLPKNETYLLSMLVNQLAFHKNNHKQLKRSSDIKISMLEAQLARRDFEIQSYRPCICVSSHAHGSQPKGVPAQSGAHATSDNNVVPPKYPFTKDENIPPLDPSSQLEETAHRQRLLQTEVALLHEKLDNEKRLLYETFPTEEHVRTIAPEMTVPPNHSLNIDANDFQAEHHRVANFVPPENDKNDEQLRQCLLLEEECIRLRKSEQELRQKLLLASATEQVLRDSMTDLQEQLRNVNGCGSTKDEISNTPAMTRMNHVQAELEEARAEADRRQLAIDELHHQIAQLQINRTARDTG